MTTSVTANAKAISATKTASSVDVSALKAGMKHKGIFRWTTASLITAATLAVFAADFIFLDTNGEAAATWLSTETIKKIQSSVLAGNFFALDFFLVASLLCFVAFKLGLRQLSKKKDNKGQTSRSSQCHKSSTKPASNQSRSATTSAGNATPSTAAARGGPAERPVARWNQAIDSAARQGDCKMAGRLLLEFERQAKDTPGGKPDTVSYNLVIRACAKKGDFKGAEQWLSRMELNGVEATVCSYNTVLDSCAKADNAEACEAWLQTMLSKGIEANVISYATVIYARARRGQASLAEAWLKKMTDAGIAPDAVCYNSMMHACGVSGNAAGAEHWIEEMQANGLEATVTTFTALIDACAKAGDVSRAQRWLEAMISAGISPNVVTFSAMIDACAKSSNPALAGHWHERMVECNVKPNAHSFSAVINACAKAGDVDMAEEWLGKCEQAGEATDVVVYSSVIDACGKVNDADRALVIFQRMQAHGIRPHIVAYAALARPFAYKGDWMMVERIAKEMSENSVWPNEYFLYAQLLSYATTRPRQSERAEKCFRDALKSGLKANDHVVCALARAVGRERCTELMAELCNGRSVPLPPASRRGKNSDRA